ncbi:hypothetical protein CEXT_580101 [Caerostris extrusa]|uniref:Uncharacterized protein n=1 Tax=Caerostris extrusa TaxID=172846 RepID=A0AAV4M979_CAEEX|nr:hypothetical protein CEXT_580101 [Caerostris extrusa]
MTPKEKNMSDSEMSSMQVILKQLSEIPEETTAFKQDPFHCIFKNAFIPKCMLTKSRTKGARMEPTRAHMEQDPRVALRTLVGKTSTV